MAKITKAHNNKIINNGKSTYQDKCNCRIKEEGPLPVNGTAKLGRINTQWCTDYLAVYLC